MKLFTKNTFRNLALVVLGAAALSACGGAGSCATCANPTPTPAPGDVTLTLTAPNQYPAGLSTPITAYLTMNNTSNVNATNLNYAVPSETNYTGVAITVVNGASNPCLSIPAQQSCTFPVTISAYAHTGSFTVTATPNSSASQSTVKKIWSSLKSELGLQAGTLSLTANIGLTNVPANPNSGANGITFLYSSTIASSESGDTLLSVVGVVNSAEAGVFNTINLTDQSGNPLSFTVLSGNSGQGATNLGLNSLVTFLLRVPASAAGSTFNFYSQTVDNNGGGTVNQGTIANPITVGTATAGVLVIQPTNFSLTAPSNESQIISFSNIGNGPVSSLSIPTPASPLYMISNTCGSSLAAGASCTYVLGSHAEAGFSGDAEFTASYNNGSSSNVPVAAQVHYAGVAPVAGISISSGDNPTLNFVASTEFTSKSSQLTLTNTGNVSESNFVFTVPQYFALTAGTTGTPCTLSGNTVTTVLTKDSSCTLNLTYTNATITASSPASLLVDYKFHDVAAPQSSIPLTYQTVQASAILQVTSPVLPYTFPNIRANQVMSESQVYVYTNIGTGTATNVTANPVVQGGGTVFNVIPSSPSTANDCGSSITSLAPSATCQVTVQFGPTASPANTYTEYLPVSYESIPATTPVVLTTTLNGTLLPANSANIIVSAVGLSPAALGGNGESAATAFAFESSNSNLTVTLTYKNIGNDAASNLVIDSTVLPNAYSLISNDCNNQPPLAINATCTVVIQRSLMTLGDANIALSKSVLYASWTDDKGSMGPLAVQWDNNGVMYPNINITVHPAPSVTAMMSYESEGVTAITEVNVESNFYVVFKLIDGYKVAPQTFTASSPTGFSPTSGSCSIPTESSSCFIQFTAPATAESNQTITLAASGSSLTPSPQSFVFDVVKGYWTFVGQEGISSGGINYASLAFDSLGTPYVAYKDWDAVGSPGVVKKFDGLNWVDVCSANDAFTVSDVDGHPIDLAINPTTDEPYVAFSDKSFAPSLHRATVKKCATGASSWTTVGSSGFGGNNTAYIINIAFPKNSGTPYVVYTTSRNADGCPTETAGLRPSMLAFSFNGSSWVAVGNRCFGYGNASYLSLAFSQGDPSIPYVGYAISETMLLSNRPAMVKLSGGTWTDVGGSPLINADSTTSISAAFPANSNTPYLAYGRVNAGSGAGAKMLSYDGSAWNNVGGEFTPTGQAKVSAAFNPTSANPYAAYSGNPAGGASLYNGSSWGVLGEIPIDGSPDLVFNPVTNKPYIAFANPLSSYKLSVVVGQ